MPYIKQKYRDKFIDAINEICGKAAPQNAGELNYLITQIAHIYLSQHPGYQGANDIMGALEGVKLELYRRDIAEYEDEKIKENGDI